MKVWILHNSEILPIDGSNVRIQRVGIIGKMLQEQGHKVVWWTSTFDHLRKLQRYEKDTRIELSENYALELIRTPGYKKNISLSRLIDHAVLAKKFFERAKNSDDLPDVIFSGLPTIDLSKAAIKVGKIHHIPVIIDARDYWPEIFQAFFPAPLKGLSRIFLFKMFRDSEYVFRNATAIFGHAPKFMEWGLKKANRHKTELDNYYPFGYRRVNVSDSEIINAELFWDNLNIKDNDGWFNIVFLGTIGHLFDFETAINAYSQLTDEGFKVRLILGGKGEKVESLKKVSSGMPGVLFPGWLGAAEIHVLLRRSHLGLYPVLEDEKGELFGSYDTIPNKAPEYLSASLPIASALKKGFLHELIEANRIGINYNSSSQILVHKIKELIKNSESYHAMRKNAEKIFSKSFEADVVYSGLIANIQNVITNFKNHDGR